MRSAGIAFDVVVADVDETPRPNEQAADYVQRLAVDKARAVSPRAQGRRVLAADTVVVVDGAILGKPRDEDDARRMLGLLSGRVHSVLTGVALDDDVRVACTSVEFAPLSAEEIAWYVASGEPSDKAGAYAIQGLASRFVTRIDGSYSNVVGLPVALVYEMLSMVAASGEGGGHG